MNNVKEKKVIRHELGHWFVAKEVGFDVGGIQMKIIYPNLMEGIKDFGHEASSRSIPYLPIGSISDLEMYLVNRGAAVMAGAVFQCNFNEDESDDEKDNENDIFNNEAVSDYKKIEELSLIYYCIKSANKPDGNNYEKYLNEYKDIIRGKVKKIIDENKSTLNGMIISMHNESSYKDFNGEFSKEELTELCERHAQ